MKRKIIEIDEAKCNGCGLCIPNCQEGALQLIDGKARLVSDLFCDGLGACIGECPQGAIRIVEREAEPYDERKVISVLAGKGSNTIRAHMKHLKDHGEFKLLEIARAYLAENGIAPPEPEAPEKLPCGCPGTLAKKLAPKPAGQSFSGGASALRQWPIQLKLLNPAAEYFDGADLLVAADCVAYAHGGFHRDFLAGRILIVFCPKLDSDLEGYVAKLAEIFRRHDIRSVTVARMEVPCCGGTAAIVQEALRQAGRELKIQIKIVGLNGEVQN